VRRKRGRRRPGEVRDAILAVLSSKIQGLTVAEIDENVRELIGGGGSSSVRSYLRLNSKSLFVREERGIYSLRGEPGAIDASILSEPLSEPLSERGEYRTFSHGRSTLIQADCLEWLRQRSENSIHAVVTDPPYGLIEYAPDQQQKLRKGRGGVWRIPPSFDGVRRSPVPRFTVLSHEDLGSLAAFFLEWGRLLVRVLVPGANVVVASNPLLSYVVSAALVQAGLERRGEIVRLVMTMRGGDRPKAAHEEFGGVSVMPRSMWEPWLLFRKPIQGRVQDNLRNWKTGGFRRPSADRPFGDVILSSPTHKTERALAPHPSLKPQSFLRALVRGVLPLGDGVILDAFAGAGSALAAAEAVGYSSIGIEKDVHYYEMATRAIPKLAIFKNGGNHSVSL
jgi:DNA modification methylase